MNTDQPELNGFQKRVEARLNAWLEDIGLRVDSRHVVRETIPSLPSEVPEVAIRLRARDLEVAIRENSVGFTIAGQEDYCEALDYRDADALADAFLATLTKRWGRQHGP